MKNTIYCPRCETHLDVEKDTWMKPEQAREVAPSKEHSSYLNGSVDVLMHEVAITFGILRLIAHLQYQLLPGAKLVLFPILQDSH